MQKFEYRTVVLGEQSNIDKGASLDIVRIENDLNELGSEGWELVTTSENITSGYTTRMFLIFKRALS